MPLPSPPLFVRRDLDGFFGLFIDNLVQLLVIAQLTAAVCGFPPELIYGRILPAAAVSIILGNVYYALHARAVARREGREDVTALPYGINTPSVFAYIFFIMAPIYAAHREELGPERAATLAWQVGLAACLGSGFIEFFGAFVAERVRRATPRAALLAPLAGIAIGFISMDFVLQVFERPLLALLPTGIILMQYLSGARLPLGLPAGLMALLTGTLLGWGIKGLTLSPLFAHLSEAVQGQLRLEVASMPSGEELRAALVPALALPRSALGDLWAAFRGENASLVAGYVGVILPMGLFNLVGSLQNIESAEAEGDRFATAPALAVNGVGTLAAAALGSCFPTTIYIGHAGWKRLGARTGYSLLNGVVITVLCLTGLIQAFAALAPIESVVGILLWIAIVITAQAFQSVPRRHALAVALGLIPAIAAWGMLYFGHGLTAAGSSLGQLDPESLAKSPAHVGGLIALDRGMILVSMGLAAMGVMMIEARLAAAAIWAWTLALLALLGVVHAWDPLDPGGGYVFGRRGLAGGWRFALAYALWGGLLYALRRSGREAHEPEAPGLARAGADGDVVEDDRR